MSTQHTPGPWFWDHEGADAMALVEEDGTTILHLATLRNSTAARHMEANAQLIAAAPELLEALQGILAGVAGCERDPKWELARVAIAKATGGAA